MKARLYQRNVLDGGKKMRVLYHDMRKEYWLHILSFIALMIVWCVLSVLLRVLLAVLVSRRLARFLHAAFSLPLTTYLLTTNWYRLKSDQEILHILKQNPANYAEWMSMQKEKITPTDLNAARQLFSQYRDRFHEQHNELCALLKAHLKKPANQLLVSVLAGLVFLSNDSADYKLLFDAKYRRGAAGNMIPDIWIRVLNPDEQDTAIKSHSECAEEFLSYWDQKSKPASSTAEAAQHR